MRCCLFVFVTEGSWTVLGVKWGLNLSVGYGWWRHGIRRLSIDPKRDCYYTLVVQGTDRAPFAILTNCVATCYSNLRAAASHECSFFFWVSSGQHQPLSDHGYVLALSQFCRLCSVSQTGTFHSSIATEILSRNSVCIPASCLARRPRVYIIRSTF